MAPAWLRNSLLRRPSRASSSDGISSMDDVYPLHPLDHLSAGKTIMTWTMMFNDVLDPELLRTSLQGVLEVEDWRKLGGRLRKHGSRYRLHVPPCFTKERPSITFTKQILDTPILEHPLGRQMPRLTACPSIQADPSLFTTLHLPADAPRVFEDYVSRGLPPISLHVVVFSDATIGTLAWPHIIMDAAGLRGLVAAWNLSLHGKISEIPRLAGARHDVAVEVTRPENNDRDEDCLIEKQSLSFLGIVLLAVRFLSDICFGPKMESRILLLPKIAIQSLRKQAECDLGSLDVEPVAPGAGNEVRGQISKGDILLSWIVRIIASALPAPRPITALSTVDIRERVPYLRELSRVSSVCVQNLTLPAMTHLSSSTAATSSLGQIAAANRRSFMQQLTTPQIVATLRVLQSENHNFLSGMRLMAEPNTLLVTLSNWASHQLCRLVDFSPAVIQDGDVSAERKNPRGTMLYHYPGMVKRASIFRNVVYILGTDHEENYWLSVILDSRTLSKVEEGLRLLSRGTNH